MRYIGGLGPPGCQVWNQVSQNSEKERFTHPHFGEHFGAFSVFVADVFFVDFGRCFLSALFEIVEPKGRSF